MIKPLDFSKDRPLVRLAALAVDRWDRICAGLSKLILAAAALVAVWHGGPSIAQFLKVTLRAVL